MKKKFLILVLTTSLFVSCEDTKQFVIVDWAIYDWINVDPNAVNIVKVKFKIKDSKLIVNMWGACEPDDCPWGSLEAPIVNPNDSELVLHWNHGFKTTDQTLKINSEGELVVNSFDIYLDNSGRTTRTYVDIFRQDNGD